MFIWCTSSSDASSFYPRPHTATATTAAHYRHHHPPPTTTLVSLLHPFYQVQCVGVDGMSLECGVRGVSSTVPTTHYEMVPILVLGCAPDGITATALGSMPARGQNRPVLGNGAFIMLNQFLPDVLLTACPHHFNGVIFCIVSSLTYAYWLMVCIRQVRRKPTDARGCWQVYLTAILVVLFAVFLTALL